MRIAVCEDQAEDLRHLVALLKAYDQSGRFEIAAFDSAAALYDAAVCQNFDIAILDIEMPKPNGYEIACRMTRLEKKPLVIFVTNSMAYTLRGYGVAFRYLSKPVDPEMLASALDAAIQEVNAKRFVLSVDAVSHVFRMEEIYYFEVFDHYTILHTQGQEITFRASLREVLAQLPAGYFGMPHRSYIVNFAHVKTVTAKEVHLLSGACIPISRYRQKEFEQQLYRFLGR